MEFLKTSSVVTCLYVNEPDAFKEFTTTDVVNLKDESLRWRFRIGSVLGIRCLYPDYRTGPRYRTCQSNGTWSYQGPACSEGNVK